MARLLSWLLAAAGAAAILAAASVALPARPQALLALITAAASLLLALIPGRAAAALLAALSAAVSVRYLVWRFAETIPHSGWAAWALGTGLLAAETYAAAMLLLGYLRAAWPLRRPPLPLPPDPLLWPSVDVFIPTLDEPLAVVRPTVLAALAMDWPPQRLAVWLLDDGNRPELGAFAAAAGCRYLARAAHAHAKAGNLNHALAQSQGELIAVFDCDQAPSRAFLQLTAGWLAAAPEMAFVQTPQHSRTPDLFQRLPRAGGTAAEEALFHRLLQDGADTLGATLFTGSGALLRRSALLEAGGFATYSLTEDAATSLRLHRRGWDSAFLPVPLAAGLAPQTLGGLARQRARWLRGMLAILARDPPLLGRGLSLAQRLCYLQSALHFLFPLPRLVFLTAPLVFLFAGSSVIAAAPAALAAYAGPHLLQALLASARLHGRFRRPLWGQVHEAALACALLPATVAALLGLGRPRFTATPKGAAPAPAFAWRQAWPVLALAALLAAGLAAGGVRLAAGAAPGAVILNCAWAALGLLILLAAAAAARGRTAPERQAATLPASLRLADGRVLTGRTSSFGPEMATVALDAPGHAAGAAILAVTLPDGAAELPGQVLACEAGLLQFAWTPASLAQHAALARLLYGRADAWTAPPPRRRRASKAWRAAALAALLLAAAPAALAQQGGDDMTVRPVPGLPGEAAPPPPAPAMPAPQPPAAPSGTVATGTRTVVYTLHQLGAAGPLALRGTAPVLGIDFGLRADEVVTAAALSLSGAISPALIPAQSQVTVTLNGQYVATIPADRRTPAFTLDAQILPSLFQDANRLDFHFAGRSEAGCEDPLSGLLWATIADSSTLTLTLARLPPQRDLSRLPLPFFDPHDPDPLSLPFVLPAAPADDTLRAAGIAAAWLGTLATAHGADFPVRTDLPPAGNAVLIAAGDGSPVPGLPPLDGPTLAVLPNPHDPLGSLLVIAGRTGAEAAQAATALAMGIRVLGGATASVQMPDLPLREPYDAPAWIGTDRPVRLGELASAAALQSSGYTGLVRVPFRTAPDLYTWRGEPFRLDLRWRAPPAPVAGGGSRLDAGLDGAYLASLPLAAGQARLALPAGDVTGNDALELYSDARPMRRGRCGPVPGDLRMAVSPDSTIDLTRAEHAAALPDLAYFANAGFPFTRLADLSQTAIVLPDRPEAAEMSAFLGLMARFGAETGLPGVRVSVVRPEEAGTMAARDLLLIGTTARMQAADPLLSGSPVRLSGDRMQVALAPPLPPWRRWLDGPEPPDRNAAAGTLSAAAAPQSVLLTGAESPLQDGRSVVALLAGGGAALEAGVASLGDPQRAGLVRGDLAILSGGQVTSYRIGPTYTVGSLPFWMWPDWYLRGDPYGPLGLMAAGAVLLAWAVYRALRRRAERRLRRPPEP